MRIRLILPAVVLAVPLLAQQHDFGIHGGGSLYLKRTITNPAANADAGFSFGWAGGVSVGHDMYDRVGGELRYTYLRNQMKLESGSAQAKFGGEAHAVHYDVLVYASDTGNPVRPYLAVGGGGKIFRGTGAEQAFQPLSSIGILTRTTDTKPMVSVGGGVKMRLSDRIGLRIDVHDYLTPFPKKVITPASGSQVGGWLNNIVATVGLWFGF
jgi:hypothetical protein